MSRKEIIPFKKLTMKSKTRRVNGLVIVAIISVSSGPSATWAFSPLTSPHCSISHRRQIPWRWKERRYNTDNLLSHFSAPSASTSLSESETESVSSTPDRSQKHNIGEMLHEVENLKDKVLQIPAIIEDGADALLPRLQLPRALEIRVVLVKDVLKPLIASFLAANQNNKDKPTDWEEFWSQRATPETKTNAQYVALALEELGPIYVKFGQLLAARPDIVPQTLADELVNLQDRMEPFNTTLAHEIIRDELVSANALTKEELDQFMDSLTEKAVAAASIGQVYRGTLPSNGKTVAVKVKRPGIRETVERDAEMLRSFSDWLDSLTLPGQTNRRLIAARIGDAVEEFVNRVFEEMDYRSEAKNTQTFADYYSVLTGNSTSPFKVMVPQLYSDLCTDNVLVTEWVDGTKIAKCSNDTEAIDCEENLRLVQDGIRFTLCQLLETGLVHADPHLGNLLKVKPAWGPPQLAYLDFGILSTVPEETRDGIVCAVVDLVFAQNVTTVAQLLGESQLLSKDQYQNETKFELFKQALNETYYSLLGDDDDDDENSVKKGQLEDDTGTKDDKFSKVRMDKAMISLSKLVSQYEFTLPPYFFNNARALVTLDGIARGLDPNFNIMGVIYPFALDRLWNRPSVSATVEDNFLRLFRSPETDMLDTKVFMEMVSEMSKFTGRSRFRVILDAVMARGTRRVYRHIWWGVAKAFFHDLFARIRGRSGMFKWFSRAGQQKPRLEAN